jgi:predicted DNA-binding transcriptional regulator AlpA
MIDASLPPTLVDAPTLAAKLGLTVGQVYRLSASGRIPKYKAGHRTVRFDLGEVLRSLRNTQPAAPPTQEALLPSASAGSIPEVEGLAAKVAATLRRS